MRLFLSLLLLSLLAYAGYLGLGWVSGQYALLPPAEQPRMALIAVLTIRLQGSTPGWICVSFSKCCQA